MSELLITNATLLPLTDNGNEVIRDGYLHIREDRILALGAMADRPRPGPEVEILDVTGSLVMPGLINTHSHAAMILFRGLADDLPLMEWLYEHIFPAEARFVEPEMVYWCTKLAAAEMIRFGTTSVADGYFHESAAARAFVDAGLRAVVGQGIVDFPAPGVPDPRENIAAAVRFIEEWHHRDDLITPAIFCHSPYTCAPPTLTAAKEAARRHGVDLYIHVAETRAEVAEIRARYGTTPVRHLDGLGILDQATVCVHSIWLDEEELDILARRNARVSICPSSHMKLASGVAPAVPMLQRGIKVGLGTDGAASNNNLDIFREMDLIAKLHKNHFLDPTQLPATQVLAMATTMGAAVLGQEGVSGRLAPGDKADVIVLGLDRPHLVPFYNPISLLVYAAGGRDVDTVIVGGRLVMRDRKILAFDEAEAMAKVRELAARVGGDRL